MKLTEDDFPIGFFDEIESYYFIGKFDDSKKAKQTIDQILKNQEDVEYLRELVKGLPKDHEIVERLKKRIEELKDALSSYNDFDAQDLRDEFQKILERDGSTRFRKTETSV